MKRINSTYSLTWVILMALVGFACQNKSELTMREQEQESIFKVGEPASEEYFTGNVKAAT